MRGADIEKVKGVISQTSDNARPAYGRKTIMRQRSFIVVGTTNPTEFLKDTENRRFIILDIKGSIRHDLPERDRDQLFGEAMACLLYTSPSPRDS